MYDCTQGLKNGTDDIQQHGDILLCKSDLLNCFVLFASGNIFSPSGPLNSFISNFLPDNELNIIFIFL